jgi:hypothetical protein
MVTPMVRRCFESGTSEVIVLLPPLPAQHRGDDPMEKSVVQARWLLIPLAVFALGFATLGNLVG